MIVSAAGCRARVSVAKPFTATEARRTARLADTPCVWTSSPGACQCLSSLRLARSAIACSKRTLAPPICDGNHIHITWKDLEW
jgi:hypothetical protein